MAHLKDLIVTGAARILGKLYASEFVGKLTGTADNATKWDGYINDIGTNNSSDTWLLVAKDRSIQHRLATDFATSEHTHSYLALSGGTMGSGAYISWPDSGNWGNNNSGVTFPVDRGGFSWSGQSDGIRLYAEETSNDNLELVLRFTDDNSNGLSIRNSSGSQTARISADGVFSGSFSGNASTASKLATARNIALTGSVKGSANFDGSRNISIATTVNCGTTAPSSLANGQVYYVYEN